MSSLKRRLLAVLGAGLFLLAPASSSAEELYCEVMSVEGTATRSNATTSGKALVEGDLLSVDDVVQVGPASYIDLAYDPDWNNVTRVEENSSIRIRSLYPTTLELEEGGVFAKLKALPKDSSFDVQTPTAIASVRGTEYRTTYLEGETQVYNVSESDVYVYGLDTAGRRLEIEPVVVRNSQKTFVPRRGDAPRVPHRMETVDLQRAGKFRQSIERRVQQNKERGRVGKLQGGPRSPGGPKEGELKEGQASRRLRSEGEPSQGGLAKPYFPGGERRRQDGVRENKGPDNGPQTHRPDGQPKEDPQNGPGNQNGPQGQGKRPAQGKPAAKPRPQR